jgi:hypothetical protein
MTDTITRLAGEDRTAFLAAAAAAADEFLDESADAGVTGWPTFTHAVVALGEYITAVAAVADWGRQPVPHREPAMTSAAAVTGTDRDALAAAVAAAATEYVEESEAEGEDVWPSFTAALQDFGLYLTHGAGDADWGYLPTATA